MSNTDVLDVIREYLDTRPLNREQRAIGEGIYQAVNDHVNGGETHESTHVVAGDGTLVASVEPADEAS